MRVTRKQSEYFSTCEQNKKKAQSEFRQSLRLVISMDGGRMMDGL